jgi:hypothetical protein
MVATRRFGSAQIIAAGQRFEDLIYPAAIDRRGDKCRNRQEKIQLFRPTSRIHADRPFGYITSAGPEKRSTCLGREDASFV